MPQLTQNLADFYILNKVFDNFALATQKFGHFAGDKFDYMDDDRTKLFHTYSHTRQYAAAIPNKQTSIINQLTSQGMKVVTLRLKQHWRMAIGLGNASVYNNGFTFHPILGIPYIPGQGVKGILRNYIIKEHFNKSEDQAESDPLFCLYFGCSEKSYDNTARAGKLIFMDAFPINSFAVLPDIMNPHYGAYYGDESNNVAPHDALSPVPIIFLTIKKAEFQFNFYLKASEDINPNEFLFTPKKENNEDNDEIFYEDYTNAKDLFKENAEISAIIEKTLIEALEIKGVGAKTRVGYGRFTV